MLRFLHLVLDLYHLPHFLFELEVSQIALEVVPVGLLQQQSFQPFFEVVQQLLFGPSFLQLYYLFQYLYSEFQWHLRKGYQTLKRVTPSLLHRVMCT